jgi:1-aminocyclopropane-1-carboxylate deaminase/D-cysteine desulfhydrase-like pyridoxal-dependent ACC family enzyme
MALTALPLANLPTPLEPGPPLPSGSRLWIKRDDLTGLGLGGNKARKLGYLCARAVLEGADTLVTVGGAQSNHCRMTAAAGAKLGLAVHLIFGGPAGEPFAGNQLIADLLGATIHRPGTDDWGELEAVRRQVTDDLLRQGRKPSSIPIGGSTPLGALGFADAYAELETQVGELGIQRPVIIHTSSSGGTHAGLLAGQAAAVAKGRTPIEVVAIEVAKTDGSSAAGVAGLAAAACELAGTDPSLVSVPEVDPRWLGAGYEVATPEADAAIRWLASRSGILLDRTYTGKGFAGVLGLDADGRFEGWDPIFWHTGGFPALFAPGGVPA